jgi:hypothetical protein
VIYIVSHYADGVDVRTAWHVGDKLRFDNVSNIVEIQADGDELELVQALCKNLRNINDCARVKRWFGDEAKFIAANVLHLK